MKNYTFMNLIHYLTGYYYKSPKRFEDYINARILFKQLHFKEADSLLNEEIINIKESCNTLKVNYSNHINSLGNVYLYLIFMVLVAVTYLLAGNYFTDGGIIVFIFKNSLSILAIPTLLLLWGIGYRKAGKGLRLVNRINTLEIFLQKHSLKVASKVESTQAIQMTQKEKDVVLSCISILYKNNDVDILDDTIFTESYTYTEILSPLTQVRLASCLAEYFNNKSIGIHNSSSYKLLSESIGKKVQHKAGVYINPSAFCVELNRAIKRGQRMFDSKCYSSIN